MWFLSLIEMLRENPQEKAAIPTVTWLAFLLEKWTKAVISIWTNSGSIGLGWVPEVLKKERGVTEWRVLAVFFHPSVEHWNESLLHDMVVSNPNNSHLCLSNVKRELARSLVSQEEPVLPARIADICGVGGIGEGFIWNRFFSLSCIFKNKGAGQNYFYFAVKGRG